MKKQLIIIGIIILLLIVGLSGCSSNNQSSGKTVYNIGDSITVENIRYTFLSAKWVESWGSYKYNLEIKGENIGKEVTTGYVALLKYEMENGYKYEHSNFFIGTQFTINPGKELIQTISSNSGEIDRDFLPVAKLHIDFRKQSSNPLSYIWLKTIVLNV